MATTQVETKVDREGLKRMVDQASEEWLREAYPALCVLLSHRDWRVEDEELTEEELAEMREGAAELARGEGIPLREVVRGKNE